MEKKFKLGVIGAGFMSTAIVKGLIASQKISPDSIVVSDISEQSLERMASLGVSITSENLFVCNNSEFVLLAVKPQSFATVAESVKGCECKKFISIMAGTTILKIKSSLNNPLVARCMPNTPCSVGSGAVGIDCSDYTSEEDKKFIKSVFESFSKVVFVNEDKLDVVTGISGSAPAYYYLFVKGIIDAGVKRGLSEEDAKTLAVNTMIGSGKMIFKNTDKTLEELINAVCSKGGTTIEAIKVFKENNLEQITENAIEACIKRSNELEKL